MSTIKNIANVSEAMNLISSMFGSGEFTRKQYEDAKKEGGASINTLLDWGIIKVVRKEQFQKKVDYEYSSYAVVGFKGAITFKTFGNYERWSAERFAQDVRKNNPLITDVEIVETTSNIITAERYYFAIDFEKYSKYIENRKFEMQTSLAKAIEDREKLDRKIKALTIALA